MKNSKRELKTKYEPKIGQIQGLKVKDETTKKEQEETQNSLLKLEYFQNLQSIQVENLNETNFDVLLESPTRKRKKDSNYFSSKKMKSDNSWICTTFGCNQENMNSFQICGYCHK